MSKIEDLIKLADHLDKIGHTKLANDIDELIVLASEEKVLHDTDEDEYHEWLKLTQNWNNPKNFLDIKDTVDHYKNNLIVLEWRTCKFCGSTLNKKEVTKAQ